MNKSLRIIAGSARGRRFDAPKGMDTRPTLDRVKESLFGILQFDIEQSSVLDLFSGSGNLGLEAASRGASRVVCNDRSRECAEQIKTNAIALRLEAVTEVLCMDYAACIEHLRLKGETFDLVFLDAPYADGTAQRAMELLFLKGLLSENGRVVIEHAANLPPSMDESLARLTDRRRYGSCSISFYERA